MRRSGERKCGGAVGEGALVLLLIAFAPILCSAGILDPWQWARNDRIEVNIPWLPFENETRCYGELGCLNITRSWYHLIHRPLNVFPLPREVINTRFILYTNENPTEGQILIASKDKSIKRSNFKAKRKTKFIIHGFIDTPLSNWVKEMRNELLKHGDYNVIIVDWAGGSLPLYTQATANTRLVGLEIANLVKHLQAVDVEADSSLLNFKEHLGRSENVDQESLDPLPTDNEKKQPTNDFDNLLSSEDEEMINTADDNDRMPTFQDLQAKENPNTVERALLSRPNDAKLIFANYSKLKEKGKRIAKSYVGFKSEHRKLLSDVIIKEELKSVTQLISSDRFKLLASEVQQLFPKEKAVNYGLDMKQVHLIGHSLGAHTAGYAGEKLEGKIGRITGLDPAEPYFQGMPSHLRLDYTDAQLVDVIHTDGKSIFFLGYGMSQPCGHLDFYPNNGKEQPGCTDLSETTPSLPLTLIREGLEEASRVLVACNHVRAIKLFIESINSKCQYVAHECGSYSSFLRGECFSCKSNNSLSCGVMGYHANTSPALVKRQAMGQDVSSLLGSKFFFSTGKDDPYCRKHYRITINLARPPTAESWVQGFIKVTFHAENGIIRNIDLTPSGYMKLEHGTSTRMVVAHPGGAIGEIGKIRRVELSWAYDMDVLQPRSLCFFWCNDHLYVNNILVDVMELPGRGKRETDFSSRLCSASKRDYAEIASGSTASFVDNC